MAGKTTRKSVHPSVEVVITVDEAQLDQIEAVARRLGKAGLTAAQTLKSAGIITGSVVHDKLAGIGSVAGVKAVERSGGAQIAPPDADVQ
jgi:hypothetical protein